MAEANPSLTTIRCRSNLTARYQYTVVGQQPEVITTQMAAQSQNAPAQAREGRCQSRPAGLPAIRSNSGTSA